MNGVNRKTQNDLLISPSKTNLKSGEDKKRKLTIFSIFSARIFRVASIILRCFQLSDKFIWFPIDIYTLLNCHDKALEEWKIYEQPIRWENRRDRERESFSIEANAVKT